MQEKFDIAIYIIDDEENLRTNLNALFRRSDIKNYHIFSDPCLFLDAMNSGVQICVLDYDLKHYQYDGITLMCEVLKQNSNAKCIIMSGATDFAIIKNFLNNGAFRYVEKGEQDFSINLIGYVKLAYNILTDAFSWYKSVLEKTKETSDLITTIMA